MQQIQKRELEGMLSTTRNLALSAASTVNFSSPCPCNTATSRWISCATWGSRFFVSLNEEEIHISAIPDSERKTLVLKEVQEVLSRKLSDAMAIKVDFSARGAARLQQRHPAGGSSLLLGPLHPVAGAHQSAGAGDPDRDRTGEWLYLAALLPPPT
jgi:hypothetical protein